MLKTKSIRAPAHDEDGFRISVMSRHTENDGVTPLPDLDDLKFHEWNKVLAPPGKLVGDYYRGNLTWENFEKRYFEYIRGPGIAEKVQELATVSKEVTITLLCIEDTPEYCHRRLLAEECRRYEPGLEVEIL